MLLIIGLGNPGPSHKRTYHNLGFEALDLFSERFDFPGFREVPTLKALVSEKGNIVLAKPQTFMNLSGQSALHLVKAYKPDAVIFVHDEIDIPQRTIKTSVGKGSAGHKGVESVLQYLKDKDITRVRIGIQPPNGKPTDVENFVLKRFSLETFEPILKEATELLAKLAKEKEGS